LIFLISGKKKSDTLLLFFTIVLLYGASIFPMSNYLSYKLEKDYINRPPVKDKVKLDVIVALSGGAYDINALNKTFPASQPPSDLFMRCKCIKNTTPNILFAPEKVVVKYPMLG